MAIKKKGLGRGLGALGLESPKEIFESQPSQKDHGEEAGARLTELSVEQLRPGKYQPRTHMDPESIASLSASIKSQGLMSPLIVRSVGEGQWEIIAGERRFRAAKLAGLTKVPVIICEVPDKKALSLSLIENIQREGLNPIEEANGMSRLMREFDMTQDQVAEVLGKSRPAVANTLRLLKLTPEVQNLLMSEKIDMGHARALLSLKEADQIALANEVVAKGWSVRETERQVAALLSDDKKKPAKTVHKKGRDVIRIEESLSDTLGAEVKLASETREKGRIVIRYSSLDQLDGLLEKLGYTS